MLKVLEQLKNEIEAEIETPFPKEDYAYLEQIETIADLGNFDMSNVILRDLAFDAGIALGLTEAEAEAIAYPVVEKVEVQSKLTDEELEREYDQLRRNYSASMSCLQDAEYYLVEEISAEGFASTEARQRRDYYEAEAEADLENLNSFKADNSALVEEIEKERSKINHKAMWNS